VNIVINDWQYQELNKVFQMDFCSLDTETSFCSVWDHGRWLSSYHVDYSPRRVFNL